MQMRRSNVVNLVFSRVIVDELDARDFYGEDLNVVVDNGSIETDFVRFVLVFVREKVLCDLLW